MLKAFNGNAPHCIVRKLKPTHWKQSNDLSVTITTCHNAYTPLVPFTTKTSGNYPALRLRVHFIPDKSVRLLVNVINNSTSTLHVSDVLDIVDNTTCDWHFLRIGPSIINYKFWDVEILYQELWKFHVRYLSNPHGLNNHFQSPRAGILSNVWV